MIQGESEYIQKIENSEYPPTPLFFHDISYSYLMNDASTKDDIPFFWVASRFLTTVLTLLNEQIF